MAVEKLFPRDAVWKVAAVACFGMEDVCGCGELFRRLAELTDGDHTEEDVGIVEEVTARATDAVAIDSRDRTRSKGYVAPDIIDMSVKDGGIQSLIYVQTDVIPARAPLASLLGVSSSFEPCLVKNFTPDYKDDVSNLQRKCSLS